jgi:hypothetical protein
VAEAEAGDVAEAAPDLLDPADVAVVFDPAVVLDPAVVFVPVVEFAEARDRH